MNQDDDVNLDSTGRFAEYFRAHLEAIRSMKVHTDFGASFRKVLYLTMLEALAKVRRPKERRARAAFVELVSDKSVWHDANRLSIPHLARALVLGNCGPAFLKLRDYVAKKSVVLRAPGWSTLADVDSPLEEAKEHWPRLEEGCGKKDGLLLQISVRNRKLNLEDFQHSHLLYGFRCKMVHEAREQTVDVGGPPSLDPYYASFDPRDTSFEKTGSREWHLVYPPTFLDRLCTQALHAVLAQLRSEQTDPYATPAFGPYMIEFLNRS